MREKGNAKPDPAAAPVLAAGNGANGHKALPVTRVTAQKRAAREVDEPDPLA